MQDGSAPVDAPPPPDFRRRVLIVLAFAAIYVLWGSTYLGIRVAMESLPPFLMAGARFFVAGVVLFGWSLTQGEPLPPARHWLTGGLLGALLLLGGNGGVVWGMSLFKDHSAPAALLVALTPLWITLLDWLRPGGQSPRPLVWMSLGLGVLGMVWMVGPGALTGHGLHPVGALAVLLATVSWSVGTVASRVVPLPRSAIQVAGMQMLTGGALLVGLGWLLGETVDPSTYTLKSVLAWVYLLVCGSLIAFTAFAWLLRVVPASLVATYAFVNPVVAVLLGAAWGEALPAETLAGGGVIVAAVALMVLSQALARRASPAPSDSVPIIAEEVPSHAAAALPGRCVHEQAVRR